MCIITQRNTNYTKTFGLPTLPACSSKWHHNQRSLPINESGTKSWSQNISWIHSACVLAHGQVSVNFRLAFRLLRAPLSPVTSNLRCCYIKPKVRTKDNYTTHPSSSPAVTSQATTILGPLHPFKDVFGIQFPLRCLHFKNEQLGAQSGTLYDFPWPCSTAAIALAYYIFGNNNHYEA